MIILNGSSKNNEVKYTISLFRSSIFEFRKQQKIFGDLSNLLSKQGFYFVAFTNSNEKFWLQELSPYRYPIGLRGSGFHSTAEAIFFRKIDHVKNMFQNLLIVL